jgi:hypothetical protein
MSTDICNRKIFLSPLPYGLTEIEKEFLLEGINWNLLKEVTFK